MSQPTYYVRQIVRPKYIVESTDEATRIVIADLPSLPIPKGNAGPSMLAHVLVNKFVDHLPFYRQSQIFKRQGLYIPESTIGGWFSASCNLLKFAYQALIAKILPSQASYIRVIATEICLPGIDCKNTVIGLPDGRRNAYTCVDQRQTGRNP